METHESNNSVDVTPGISRRTMLRRSALAGGSMVWAAPVVQTIAAPSAAAGTPLDGISYVAVVLRCDGLHYRMKWDVGDGGVLVPESGTNFNIPGSSDQLKGYTDLQQGPAPGASASVVGEVLRVDARGDCVLVDYRIKHGQGTVGPGTSGQPAVGTGPSWDFSPLEAPVSS